tara:strand:- start:15686 stop:15904 length:219 start_codon:yes stop_codon:yes gene_type:complete
MTKLFHFDVSDRSPVDNKVRAFAKATALDLGIVTKDELKSKNKVNDIHWVPLGSFKNKKDAYDYLTILRSQQ